MRIPAMVLAILFASPAVAADHADSAAAAADPTADLADLYAWTNADATKINLILTVGPLGGATGFSTAVSYAFHIESTTAYGTPGTSAEIICEFYDATNIECWAPGAYVAGDASAEAGLANTADTLRVFAGERDDPFFFELTGFNNAVAAVVTAGVIPDGTCPTVDSVTSAALVTALTAGGAATDTLAGLSVQALVVQIDKTLINTGGPLLAVSASTHVKSN